MSANKKKKQQIDAILLRMISYYQAELTPDVVELYSEALSEYPIESITDAATKHVKSSKWFPKISELIEHLKPHTPLLTSVAEEQAALVIQLIRSNGRYNKPFFGDPITQHLFTRRFNWTSLCDTLTESENKWFIKEFIQAYQSAYDICGGDIKQLEMPKEVLKLASGLFKSINLFQLTI